MNRFSRKSSVDVESLVPGDSELLAYAILSQRGKWKVSIYILFEGGASGGVMVSKLD